MLDTKGNRITYFGHSTFSLVTASGQVALIDPWVMTNPLCPAALKNVPRLDAIFLTHAHSDHLGDLLALAKQHRPKIAAIFETCLWLGSKGFEKEICPMGKGGSQTVGQFEITMTHAFHSNSIDDEGIRIYGGEPAGLVIRLPGGFTVYHAGDTALFGDDFQCHAHQIIVEISCFAVTPGIQHAACCSGHHSRIGLNVFLVEGRLDEATLAPPEFSLAGEQALPQNAR